MAHPFKRASGASPRNVVLVLITEERLHYLNFNTMLKSYGALVHKFRAVKSFKPHWALLEARIGTRRKQNCVNKLALRNASESRCSGDSFDADHEGGRA